MSSSGFSISLFYLIAFIWGAESLNYDDLIATGKYCSSQDKCEGYTNGLSYMDRNCECDTECISYNDCCIDAGGLRRRNLSRNRKSKSRKDICVPYGPTKYAGIYMVAECSINWPGSSQVREKCIGPLDLPIISNAVPVTNVQEKITYRNIFCAQCNNANMDSLKFHQLRIGCEGLQNITREQVLEDLTYNELDGTWGVYRQTSNGHKFFRCHIVSDIPTYLTSSVRFCRPNVVSTCATDWTSPRIRKKCQEYMAVVYDRNDVHYKNPHCAICNHIAPENLFCTPSETERFKPFSYTLIMDVHPGDGSKVGKKEEPTPECKPDYIYDPYFRRCKRKMCGLLDQRLVNGKCVKV